MNAFTRMRISDIVKTVYLSYNSAYQFTFTSSNEEIFFAVQANIEVDSQSYRCLNEIWLLQYCLQICRKPEEVFKTQ